MTPRHESYRLTPPVSGDWSHELRAPPIARAETSRWVRRPPDLDFGALRSLVSIRQVLLLLAWEPVGRHRGPQLRGPCPVHRSGPGSRVFSVHLEKNVYRCFKCGAQGNQLDLFAAVSGLPIYAAARELCRRLGIEPPRQGAGR